MSAPLCTVIAIALCTIWLVLYDEGLAAQQSETECKDLLFLLFMRHKKKHTVTEILVSVKAVKASQHENTVCHYMSFEVAC